MYDFNPATIASVYTMVDGPVLTLVGIRHDGVHRILGDFQSIDDLDYWYGFVLHAISL